MEAEATPEVVVESTILTEEEVKEVVQSTPNEEPKDEVVLPSDAVEDPLANLTHEELLAKVKELSEAKPVEEQVETPDAPPQNLVREYMEKFAENGDALSEADYQDLAAKGYDKDFVDTYIAGVQAANMKAAEELVKDFGGLEQFNKAKLWAKDNWTENEIAVFDKAVSEANASEDKATVKVILNSLMKEFNASSAQPNALIHTNTPPKPEIMGYGSKADMMSDMDDPRYGKDAVYTHKVEDKMGLTDTGAWYK